MSLPESHPNWFDESEVGAPTLNDATGAVIEVLRACLKNGFNHRSVTSIVVADEVATATAATHGYTATYGKLLLIEGCDEAPLNGRKQPLSVATNTFTYAAPGVADGTYSGTITAKRAPLGWDEPHVGTDVSIFSRTDPAASPSMLRVIDTRSSPAATNYAQVSMVESATDANAVTNEVPAATGANRVWMRGANNSTAKKWVVVGNSLRVWVCMQGSGAQVNVVPYLFGDPAPLYPGDTYGAFLVTYGNINATSAGGFSAETPQNFTPAGGDGNQLFQRDLSGSTVGDLAHLCGGGVWGSSGMSPGDFVAVPIIGGYHLKTSGEVRSKLPELYLPQANVALDDRAVYEFDDEQYLCMTVNVSNTGSGQMLLKISGDWS